MLKYFPKPYEEELFYSIVARYHFHGADIFKENTMKDLFKSTGMFLRFESISQHIKHLVDKVKLFSDSYTIDYFLDKHTMLPFVKAFKTKNWYENVLTKLNDEEVIKFNYTLYSSKKGDVKSKEHLYYCPECLKEQHQLYGEGYWNRLNQIPGVFVCIKHQVPLIKHPVNIVKIKNHNFIYPNPKNKHKHEVYFETKLMGELISIAQDIDYLLHKDFSSFSKEYYLEKYETLLKVNGMGYPMLKRHRRLSELIQDHYSQTLLEMLNSSFLIDDRTSWIKYVLGEGGIYFCHPIRHILVMRCLCGTAKNFFEKEYAYEPFGKGPWICMNRLADHYLQKCVEKVEVSVHGLNREVQGDFLCSCGFVYRLREWEQNPLEVPYFNNRIMQKGYVWEREFNKLLSNQLTQKEIALRTNFSTNTIRKILDDREKITINISKQEKLVIGQRKKTLQYKQEWIKLRNEYPNYTRASLNILNRAAYAWLNKYDKSWLEEHSPSSVSGKNMSKKSVEDYHKEDLAYVEEAKKVIHEWEKYEEIRGKLIRKTYAAVSTILASYNKLAVKQNYPLLVGYISTLEESVQDFQKRRVRHQLDTRFKGKVVTLSEMIDSAGVKVAIKNGVGHIKEYVEKLVRDHNNENFILQEENHGMNK
ncbi:TnsD family Tn7-like transposition protein [Bacillus toyonensis]|uniref:TnsD family Tn7-like transposition protein n=1 Tax=Bacillus toyonensis TaxID=155322 RepID=UPI0021D357EC|nr:TnsD family Tn7-like transposition protein [Bacillus toyonensis]MCU4770905.1 TnsD family transposase [Bacillus toyonensis]